MSEIIHAIAMVDGVTRIRIGSVDPNEMDDSLLNLVVSNPKVCAHLHIPLQSGSDRILAQMRRQYRTKDYRAVVTAIANRLGVFGLTTDVIVGFPGENETQFQETYDFIRAIGFSKLHIFKYSPREGTEAANHPYQVRAEDKDRRSAKLLALSDALAYQFHQSFLGNTVEVLVEQVEQGRAIGLSSEYVKVTSTGDYDASSLVGQVIKVKINQIDSAGMAGILS